MPKGIAIKYSNNVLVLMRKNGTMPRRELAELINQNFGTDYTADQIQSKCTHMGLKTGRTGMLVKGGAPWNKGIKNSTGFSKTRWGKGNIPHTARPVGYERINRDGHIEIKVEGHRQMVYKHRWVWEQKNGPIPKGHVVSFKNGIRTDCSIDNLILLTRAELARLNQSYIKYSTPETHETCVLMAKVLNATSKAKRCN